MPCVPAVRTPTEHIALVRETGAALVVIDSYVLSPAVYSAVRATGTPVLAVVDGDLGGRQADIYLDQNIGAETLAPVIPSDSVRLAGLDYTLLRDEILAARPDRPPTREDQEPTEIFAFFGGTDAYGAAPAIAGILAETGEHFSATVVAGSPERAEAISAVPLSDGQSIEIIEPTTRLVEHVTRAAVVLSAAGTSTWELMCLGAATGLVCVVDNQYDSYRRMLGTGAVVGLGRLNDLAINRSTAVAATRRLMTDRKGRDQLRTAAWRLMDGQGRRRVADAALGKIGIG